MACRLRYSSRPRLGKKTANADFFTSDTHFDDTFAIQYFKRPSAGLSFGVGVDCTDFTPLSLESVAFKVAQLAKGIKDA